MAKAVPSLNQTWSALGLSVRSVNDRLALCPEFLRTILTDAIKSLGPKRIWIFGSRARGDQRPLSDYDLAFDFDGPVPRGWTQFLFDIEEKAATLLKIDIVEYGAASNEMKASIEKGILLYER